MQKTEDIVLRRIPKECAATYKINYTNGGYEWTESTFRARHALERGNDVTLHLFMDEITVDGIYGNRLDHRIHQPHFYDLKPLNDGEDDWDAPYVRYFECDYCEKPFELDDERFLRTGNIYCVCGEHGED